MILLWSSSTIAGYTLLDFLIQHLSGCYYCFGEGPCQTHLDDFPIKDTLFCQVIKKAKVVWKLCEWYETTGSKYSFKPAMRKLCNVVNKKTSIFRPMLFHSILSTNHTTSCNFEFPIIVGGIHSVFIPKRLSKALTEKV